MAQPDAPARRSVQLARRGASVPAVQPHVERTSAVTLIKDALGETADVLQAQLELAVLEVREDARVAVRAGIGFGVGAALGFVALGLVATAATLGLSMVVQPWLACLVVAAVFAAAAGIYVASARRRLQGHDFTPQTRATLEEHAAWISETKNSDASES